MRVSCALPTALPDIIRRSSMPEFSGLKPGDDLFSLDLFTGHGVSIEDKQVLVVKNLYEPLFPGKTEKHYMFVARATVPAVLIAGICIGLYLNSVIALLKFAIVLLVIWGAPITLIFLWRRLTETAVREVAKRS